MYNTHTHEIRAAYLEMKILSFGHKVWMTTLPPHACSAESMNRKITKKKGANISLWASDWTSWPIKMRYFLNVGQTYARSETCHSSSAWCNSSCRLCFPNFAETTPTFEGGFYAQERRNGLFSDRISIYTERSEEVYNLQRLVCWQ